MTGQHRADKGMGGVGTGSLVDWGRGRCRRAVWLGTSGRRGRMTAVAVAAACAVLAGPPTDADRFEHVTNAAGVFQKTSNEIEQLGPALKPR